ncbi:MAG: glycosyltransferase [Eubacteriales bacterium]|nr:glycosyltransferase [Eubacteriales bacterium]
MVDLNADNCVRVLQLNSGSKNFGGVSSFLYNVYTHIDRYQVQFDFLSPNETTYGLYREEIESAGAQIFELNIRGNILTRKLKLYSRLKKFLQNSEYQIIHINSGNFFFNLFSVMAARNARIPTRIVHSHNAGDLTTSPIKRMFFKLLKPYLEKNATHLWACSRKAAEYMFQSKSLNRVIIIPNGIVTERFTYHEEVRKKIRKEINVEDKFVVGHVGRFLPQKNHEFLIDIFAEIYKKEPNAVLLLLGQGELENKIRERVNQFELNECVRFLGIRNDIENIYQAMDVFILPSFHEGLPVTGIEVQASGLPIVLSDSITEEVKLTKYVRFLSLTDGASKWADALLAYRDVNRKDQVKEIYEAGYDINQVAKRLERFYLQVGLQDHLI